MAIYFLTFVILILIVTFLGYGMHKVCYYKEKHHTQYDRIKHLIIWLLISYVFVFGLPTLNTFLLWAISTITGYNLTMS